jgi:hypothetical protein
MEKLKAVNKIIFAMISVQKLFMCDRLLCHASAAQQFLHQTNMIMSDS